MKKTVCGYLVIMLLAGLCIGYASQEAAAGEKSLNPIKIRLVSFLPRNHETLAGMKMFVDMVNKAGKGELVLAYVGGPETIAMFEQAGATRSGAIDACAVPSGFYKSLLPEADSFHLSRVTIEEEKRNGFIDLQRQLHEKVNLYLLGRCSWNVPFSLFSTKPIKNPREDFKGLRFRTAAIYDAFMRALGITPITMKQSAMFEAAQRGLIDGMGCTIQAAKSFRLYEVVNYVNGSGFYQQNIVTLINLKKWNSLPKHLKDLLIDVQAKMEPKMAAYFEKRYDEVWAEMMSKGLKHTTWSEVDNKWYSELAYSAYWKQFKAKCAPDIYPKFVNMLTGK